MNLQDKIKFPGILYGIVKFDEFFVDNLGYALF